MSGRRRLRVQPIRPSRREIGGAGLEAIEFDVAPGVPAHIFVIRGNQTSARLREVADAVALAMRGGEARNAVLMALRPDDLFEVYEVEGAAENERNPMGPSDGQIGYEAYAKSTGGKTYDGRDMPAWDALTPNIMQAWEAAGAAVIARWRAADPVPAANEAPTT